MIKAILFDLDGTLVRTENLKALSYAGAAISLRQGQFTEADVIGAYAQVVGRSRKEVSETLLREFSLEPAVIERIADFQVDKPWEAFARIRLGIYETMLSNPAILEDYKCPFNVAFLHFARQEKFLTGLATMSHRPQALNVLSMLGIKNEFHIIAAREDVINPKPDPEIYLLIAHTLAVQGTECLVIEDSVAGIQAVKAAGMWCIAVTTDITRKAVHHAALLPKDFVVDDPSLLKSQALRIISDQQGPAVMKET